MGVVLRSVQSELSEKGMLNKSIGEDDQFCLWNLRIIASRSYSAVSSFMHIASLQNIAHVFQGSWIILRQRRKAGLPPIRLCDLLETLGIMKKNSQVSSVRSLCVCVSVCVFTAIATKKGLKRSPASCQSLWVDTNQLHTGGNGHVFVEVGSPNFQK